MATIPVKPHLTDIRRVKNPQGRRMFLRLDKNENTIDFDGEIMGKFKNEITPDFLSAYPEIGPLYQKIAARLNCEAENIYVVSGSDAAIKAVFEVFVEKSDKVALLHPTYAMYYIYGEIFQAKLLKINFKEDLSLDVEEVLKLIDMEKPKLVCLANPNAPTGTVIAPDDIKKIASLCLQNNSILLLDEAYYPYYPHSAVPLIYEYPNLVVTRTFSKAMGLASVRLGFAIGCKEIIESLHKVRPMYETNAFAAKFGEIILDNYGIVEKNVAEVNGAKEYLEKELDNLGLPHFKSYANFLLINVGSPEKALFLGKAMEKRNILIATGFRDAPLKNCIRVTIGSPEQMRQFIENLKQALDEK